LYEGEIPRKGFPRRRTDDSGAAPRPVSLGQVPDRERPKKRPPAGSLIREVSGGFEAPRQKSCMWLPYGSTNCVRFKGLEYLRLSPVKGTPSKVTTDCEILLASSAPPAQGKPTSLWTKGSATTPGSACRSSRACFHGSAPTQAHDFSDTGALPMGGCRVGLSEPPLFYPIDPEVPFQYNY